MKSSNVWLGFFAAVLSVSAFAQPASAQLLYTVHQAISNEAAGGGPKTETYVAIRNTSNVTCAVQVQWFDRTSAPTGVSPAAPEPIPPGEVRTFTTANAGEGLQPFFANASRNLDTIFEGYALIGSSTGDCNSLGVQAQLVSYYPNYTNTTPPYMVNLSVTQGTSGRVGDSLTGN